MKHRIAAILPPVLYGILPVIFLYSQNRGHFGADVLLLPVVLSVLLALLITGVSVKLTGSIHKAGLFSSLFIILFFSYGKVSYQFEGFYIKLPFIEIGVNKTLIALECALLAITAVILRRSSKKLELLSPFLLISAATALLLSAAPVFYHLVSVSPVSTGKDTTENKSVYETICYPDIYYIILDGYAREDILQSRYGYSDSILIPYLRRKNFHIADSALSNYSQTVLSLASSLNFRYLDEDAANYREGFNDIRPMRDLIRNNRAFTFLKNRRYTTVSFSSGYWPTEIMTADLWLSSRWALHEFNNGILSLTPLPLILKLIQADQYDLHRKRILYIFDSLEKSAKHTHPKIVFAHITSPHPPFAFDAEGARPELRYPFSLWDGGYEKDTYRQLYTEQLQFIAKKTVVAIDSILSNSAVLPVIIVQSDHGPGSGLSHNDITRTDLEERMSILHALFLPGSPPPGIITPVNTFRVIFNALFDAGLEPLQEKSCFSTWSDPYQFIDVTSKVR